MNTHGGIALDHRARAQQLIGGIGRLGGLGGQRGVMGFPCRRLASEGTLVNGEVETVDQFAIGRHFLACIKNDDIAHNDVATRHLGDVSRTHDLDLNVVIGLVEQAEFLIGIDLDQKAHQRCQHNGNKDA